MSFIKVNSMIPYKLLGFLLQLTTRPNKTSILIKYTQEGNVFTYNIQKCINSVPFSIVNFYLAYNFM